MRNVYLHTAVEQSQQFITVSRQNIRYVALVINNIQQLIKNKKNCLCNNDLNRYSNEHKTYMYSQTFATLFPYFCY